MAVGERESGLFFSQLDSQQTSEHSGEHNHRRRATIVPGQKEFDRRAAREAFRLTPALPSETHFRHSGWMMERERVSVALMAANVSQSRFERFHECGGDCLVEWSPTRKRYRLRANYCGDRFCLPCARARSLKIERALVEQCKTIYPLFMTLTLRGTDDPLATCLDRLYASFKNLRRSSLWKSAVKGGVAVTEIKRGSGSGQWHVHLHIIAESRSIDARRLSDAWRKASSGSFIVDVSRVRHDTRGIGYVAKYAGKGWTAEVVRDPESLLECVVALRGRRLLITFGSWKKLDLESDDGGADDWKRVGRLDSVIRSFERGEAWAAGVMHALRNVDEKARSDLPAGGAH